MIGEVDCGIGRDSDRAGADRNMRLGHADHINHQRHGEDRAAAADQSKRKSNQHSGCQP